MEIRERLFENSNKAIQAINRHEIDCIPHIPLESVKQLEQDKRYFVIQYAQPRTHTIQFNPLSKVFQKKELRRALILSINREKILDDSFLDLIKDSKEKQRMGTADFGSLFHTIRCVQ